MHTKSIVPKMFEATGQPITLAFSESGRAFFSERITGNLWEILGQEEFRLVFHFQTIQTTGHHETGLLGIALDPNFETNQLIYAYYTFGSTLDQSENKIAAVKGDGTGFHDIFSGIPSGLIHNGGIINFGPDKKLYIGTGVENNVMDKSQDIDYLGGKVLRINPDGTIPADNPFTGSPVYSLGHRNVFGLAFNRGKLYISDVGPEKDDEINLISASGNYGWPKVTGRAQDEKFIDPLITYTPTITPTQCAFHNDQLYFGSYNEGTVHRLTFSDNGKTVEKDEIVYRGKPFGVIGVFVSPAGDFYATTSNRILKFEPNVTE